MKYLFVSAAFFLIISMPVLLMAQPGLPSVPTQTPIDGGLSILALAGGAYVLQKMRSKE